MKKKQEREREELYAHSYTLSHTRVQLPEYPA